MLHKDIRDYKRTFAQLPRYFVLLIAVLITMIPIIWMVFGSLKSDKEVLAVPMRWLTSEWIWSNYLDAWTAKSFSVYLKNSVIMTFLLSPGICFWLP